MYFYLPIILTYEIYQRKVTRESVMTKMRRSSKKNACTICISCNEPTEDGKMDVEMTYEGDELLAAYLLENARTILDNQLSPSKITSIVN